MVKSFAMVISLLLILLGSQPSGAQAPSVVLVLWHDLQWHQIEAGSVWDRHKVSMGILNSRIGGGNQPQGSYLTISSGSRSIGVANAERMYQGGELIRGRLAQDIFSLRTGNTSTVDQLIHLEIAELLEAAQQAQYPLQVGSLGQAVEEAGLTIGAFGTSDTGEDVSRWAGLVAISTQGVVRQGAIGSELILYDPTYPFGRKTNYPLLLTTVLNSQVDLAIIDLGDPYRFSLYEHLLLPDQHRNQEQKMIRDGWQFIDQLRFNIPNASILVLSPYPGDSRARLGQWFSPILHIGNSEGLLTSATTRWPGLVTNIDVAPTLLSDLGIDEHTMVGRGIHTVHGSSGNTLFAEIVALENRVFGVARYRSQVLRLLVGFQILVYLMSLVLLIVPRPVKACYIQILQILLMISLILPLSLLLLPQGGIWALIPFILLLVFNYRLENQQLGLIGAITLTTAVLLVFDILRGAWWIRFSFLGYDPLGGARYYGIGNEFMGILIGATIMGWAIFRGRYTFSRGFIDLTLFGGIAIVIAGPQWGTNVGGAITAIIGFGVTWMGFMKIPLQLRTLLVLAFVLILALTGLMIYDGLRPEGEQSHIGQTVNLIHQEGFTAIWMIITRKLSMNMRLFRYSFWSRGLIVAIIAMGASLIWPSSYLRWLLHRHPLLVRGLLGTLAATISALIVNDSGVVAAATCSFFAATTMLTLALSLKHNLIAAEPHIE